MQTDPNRPSAGTESPGEAAGGSVRDDRACKNTDREIWREREGDYYADSIHVTKGGGIGIDCGGTVYVKPIREWHRLAGGPFTRKLSDSLDDVLKALRSFVATATYNESQPHAVVPFPHQYLLTADNARVLLSALEHKPKRVYVDGDADRVDRIIRYQADQIESLTGLLAYAMDEENMVPRSSSACREHIRRELDKLRMRAYG